MHHPILNIVLAHGYSLLLGWVFLEQLGLPVPSIPLLLAAGALSGLGRLNLAACLILATLASLVADIFWYELGRQKGVKVVQWLCKVTLEPDSCVRRTEGVFERLGAKSLLIAKFVPGLNAVATPLAGIFRMKFGKFLRELRISRITVDELKEKIDAGEEVTIVDLRHSLDFEADPETIPGALHFDSAELSLGAPPWPLEREIVLYCT